MMSVPDAPHAERERVFHSVGSLRVSCVARRRNAQLKRQIEDRMKALQRHNALCAGKVRTHDAAPQKFLCQTHRLQVFRHIDRLGSDTHRAEQNPCVIARILRQRLPPALQYCLDCLPLRKTFAPVKLRGKANFIVNVSLPGKLRHQVLCHTGNRLLVLHELQGQLKARQICVHIRAVARFDQPVPETFQRFRGHRDALFLRQRPHGFRRNRAVQMQVQLDHRKLRLFHIHLSFFSLYREKSVRVKRFSPENFFGALFFYLRGVDSRVESMYNKRVSSDTDFIEKHKMEEPK